MSQETKPDPFFIADHVALDFINSVAQPRKILFDWMETGKDLLNWFQMAGLLEQSERNALEKTHMQSEFDQYAQDIRLFREEFRTFIEATLQKGSLPDEHFLIPRLNHLMAEGTYRPTLRKLNRSATFLTLSYQQPLITAQDLLPRIARECAHFLSDADIQNLRKCEGPTCSLYFLDISKNHRRRWCSMKVCGNRAKAAKHRKKIAQIS